MRNINIHDITMAMIGPPALLACGISAVVGVFLTWVIVPLYDELVLAITGWQLIIGAHSLPLPTGESFAESYLVLAGGGLTAFCGVLMVIGMIPAVTPYPTGKRVQWARLATDIGACTGAAVAAVGAIWFIPHIFGLEQEGTIGIGFYLVLVAAVLGLVFAISMSASYWQNVLKRINALYKGRKGGL